MDEQEKSACISLKNPKHADCDKMPESDAKQRLILSLLKTKTKSVLEAQDKAANRVYSDMQNNISSYINFINAAFDSSNVLGATVSISNQGETHHLSLGYSDTNFAPMTKDKGFRVLCMSKVLVTYTALILCDKGLLDLEKTLGEALPYQFGKYTKLKSIKLKNLLQHRAGFDESAMNFLQKNTITLSEFVEQCNNYEFIGEPGQHFIYSPSSLILVAYLIECVCGKSWKLVVNELLFEPLNITPISTSYEKEFIANSYRYELNSKTKFESEEPLTHSRYLEPAYSADILLTSEDILKLVNLMLNNGCSSSGREILSRSSIKSIVSIESIIQYHPVMSGWGMGWFNFCQDVYGFLTGQNGQHILVAFDIKEKKSIVVQAICYPAIGFLEDVFKITFNKKIFNPCSLSSDIDTCDYLGTYVGQGISINIRKLESRLLIQAEYYDGDGAIVTGAEEELIRSEYGGYIVASQNYPFHGLIHFFSDDKSKGLKYIRIKYNVYMFSEKR